MADALDLRIFSVRFVAGRKSDWCQIGRDVGSDGELRSVGRDDGVVDGGDAVVVVGTVVVDVVVAEGSIDVDVVVAVAVAVAVVVVVVVVEGGVVVGNKGSGVAGARC